MKKIIIVTVSLLLGQYASCQLRTVTNDAFQRGELLTYKAYYDALLTGQVIAGSCTFEVKDENRIINDRSTLHMVAFGKTRGAFNWFFKVVDRYESYADESAMVPWLSIRRVDEGGYIIQQDVTFNQNKHVAYFKDLKSNRAATVTVPDNILDIVSAIYYCRTIDFAKMKVNDEFRVKFLLDDTVYSTRVIYLGRETITVGIGTVKCFKFKPQVLTGTIFKDPYPVLVWVSDDKNRIPIIAESEILVGKVKLELIDFKGLKSPFSALQ
jgi:hypothetical protein